MIFNDDPYRKPEVPDTNVVTTDEREKSLPGTLKREHGSTPNIILVDENDEGIGQLVTSPFQIFTWPIVDSKGIFQCSDEILRAAAVIGGAFNLGVGLIVDIGEPADIPGIIPVNRRSIDQAALQNIAVIASNQAPLRQAALKDKDKKESDSKDADVPRASRHEESIDVANLRGPGSKRSPKIWSTVQ